MTDSELYIFYLVYALFNFSLQVGLLFFFYRSAYNALKGGKRSMNLVLKVELIVCVISLASIVFWGGRLIPVFDDLSCTIFHGFIMVLIEIQSSCYTYVQILRFMVTLGYNKLYLDICTIFVAIVSICLGAYFQHGMARDDHTCDYQHTYYTLGTAAFRILIEIVILTVFFLHHQRIREMLKRDASAGGDNRVQFVMRVLAVLLVICALWIFTFSAVNMIPGNTFLRVVISNFHFTVILFCIGLPRWMIRMRSTSTSRGTTEAKLNSSAGGHFSETGISVSPFEKGARTQTDTIDKHAGLEENIGEVSVGYHIRLPPSQTR